MLGRWLREARKQAGLSQAEVARRANTDRSYLSDLERDKQSPSVHLLIRICRAMGTSAAGIIGKAEDSDDDGGEKK
jgi:transcriptional regulator with XRE-family HTH domain